MNVKNTDFLSTNYTYIYTFMNIPIPTIFGLCKLINSTSKVQRTSKHKNEIDVLRKWHNKYLCIGEWRFAT